MGIGGGSKGGYNPLLGGAPTAEAAAAPAAAPAPAATEAPKAKPVPPPAQMSASLQAAQGQKNSAAAIGDMGGTILTSGQGVDLTNQMDQRSAASVLYGKKLTGA